MARGVFNLDLDQFLMCLGACRSGAVQAGVEILCRQLRDCVVFFFPCSCRKSGKKRRRRKNKGKKRGRIKQLETGGGLGDFTLQLTSALERDKQRRAASETQEMGSPGRDHQLIIKAAECCRSAPREKHRHARAECHSDTSEL